MRTREELWAKAPESGAPYPLACHLLDSAAAASSLWRLWMRPRLRNLISAELGEQALAQVMLLAGLHDVGKANPVFQLQLASARPAPWRQELRTRLEELGYGDSKRIPQQTAGRPAIRRHERVSAAHFAEDLFLSDALLKDSLPSVTALGHHGSFIWDNTDTRPFTRLGLGEWEAARDDLVQLVEKACGVRVGDVAPTSAAVAILLSGFVILADRIASQDSSITDAQHAMRTGLISPEAPEQWVQHRAPFFDALVEELLGTYHGFASPQADILGPHTARGAQLHADSAGDGLWMIMSPTGSGKTEAFMLRHSDQNEPLTLLLPTQATTNAMMRRLQHMYRNTKNVAALAHGEAWLQPFYRQQLSASGPEKEEDAGKEGLFPSEFVASRAARLLAPVTVGTIDQALMASLPLKWTHLRLLALANSHVVVDEVHTLDEYQVRLLQPLLRWLGATHSRVTLLSATIPTALRDRLVEAYTAGRVNVQDPVQFPSLVSLSRDGGAPHAEALSAERYTIKLELVEDQDPVANHLSWVRQTRQENPRARLGVVVNTIGRAQMLAAHLRDEGIETVVLHGRMSAKHRQDAAGHLEKALGPNGNAEGIVVVGTQAIEASLDIDLDSLSTDLAPPSSLIQRAGRVWRRPDSQRDARLPGHDALPLRVVRSKEKVGHLPYFPSELARAWTFLSRRSELAVPDDVQELIEKGTASLDDISGEIDDADDLYAELATRSLKSQAGANTAINLDFLDNERALVNALAGLTRHTERSPDTDLDFPATRYRERHSQRILITGPDAKTVPGGWTGTKEQLQQIERGDRDRIRQALAGVISVSGRMLRQLESTMGPVNGVGALRGIIAGPLPQGFQYDPLLGLVGE